LVGKKWVIGIGAGPACTCPWFLATLIFQVILTIWAISCENLHAISNGAGSWPPAALKLSLWLKLLLILKELLRSAPPMLGCMSRDCRLMPRHVLQEPLSAPCICLALEDPMFTIAPFAIMKLETRATYGGTVGSPTRLGGAVVVRYAASTMHAR